MYVLRCRSCVGRRVPLLVPFARSNSTAAAPAEPIPSPAAPKPPSSARIASSWGDIVIPSREEILSRRNKAGSKSYKPDLSYLASGESSGFASRLAANLASSPKSSVEEPSHGLRQDSVENRESPEEKVIRIQAITAARRAEREVREHAAKAAQAAARAAREAEEAAKEAVARRAAERAAVLTDQRRAERLLREAAMTPRQRLAVDASLTEARPETRREPRARGGSPKMARKASKPSASPRKPDFRIQTMPSQDVNLANAKEDITWEILEQGGDEKEPPEFVTPDVPFTDFDTLFVPSLEQSVENIIRSPVTSFSRGQIQMMREAYAGDYRRLASQTSEDSVTPPHQLGPLKHAEIVLSQRSDVSIVARHNALDIISTAVRGATGAKTSQAIVN